jgi:small subunit ribosomal protein S6
LREYELVALLHPDLEIDLDKPLKKIEKIITDLGGKILKTDNWGKRKLAYPIKKQDFAVYFYYDLELKPETIDKLDKTLNITEEVIRHLVSKHEEFPEEESKDSDKEDKKESKKESKE